MMAGPVDRAPDGGALPGRPPIDSVFLHVTNACNLRCAYCYASAGDTLADELTTAEWRRLFPDLVALGPRKVILTGGEPLIRPDTLDLLEALRAADPAHRVRRCLNTNGLLVTDAVARRLMDTADEVRVSLDALEPQHDALRGAGSWHAALDALDLLYAHGFEPKVMITVTRLALPDLEPLLQLLRARKLTRINVNLFRPIGRGGGRADWFLPPAEFLRAVRDAAMRVFPGERIVDDGYERESAVPCVAGQMLNITADGQVFPCHVLTQPALGLGNVRETALWRIAAPDGMLGRLISGDLAPVVSPYACASLLAGRGPCTFAHRPSCI